MQIFKSKHNEVGWFYCVLISDGGDQTAVSPLLCPSGLECLLDAGQLVTHMGNLRHDYSWFTVLVQQKNIIANSFDFISHFISD